MNDVGAFAVLGVEPVGADLEIFCGICKGIGSGEPVGKYDEADGLSDDDGGML